MESLALYSEFDQQTFKASRGDYVKVSPRFADTYLWAEHGIELGKVLSKNMLIKEVVNRSEPQESERRDEKTVRFISVYLCYNWRTKVEFVLMKTTLANTFSYYTPQYGRDDNYDTHTRREYQFLGYSVEAFKKEQPELARCFDAL